MAIECDRSNELYSLFNSMKGDNAPGARYSAGRSAASEQVPLQQPLGLQSSGEMRLFIRQAQAFSVSLAKVAESIMQLTKLTQRQSVFDDQSSNIAKLTKLVKASLQQLYTDLEALEELKAQALSAEKVLRSGASRRSESHGLWGSRGWVDSPVQCTMKHSNIVVESLRTRLECTGRSFRTSLQQQTRAMKDNAQRRNTFTTGDLPQTFESALFHEQERQQLQKQQLLVPNDNAQYYKERVKAVRELETTVIEVGQLFNDFTRLVHEQDEVVLRIDTDVDVALRNVDAGRNELLRYLTNLSSNRDLILKIFAVLFFFLLFFGLFIVR
ncbi:SNARE domain [Trypanosoma vivax]|uniref:Putative syntaxin 5 n=1 Tax=Trypanosoma vivax (strain Y486) TaxID=1055687 RepID=G0U4F7_TRYVY|nr:putative syntaxin 5 [Trypanosoma vivax]KAH8611417.1 SNARE domain [Trypanosoma vivax]CCC52321.1 putative syntaxin 5 [Trypanosoma vivax Y486]